MQKILRFSILFLIICFGLISIIATGGGGDDDSDVVIDNPIDEGDEESNDELDTQSLSISGEPELRAYYIDTGTETIEYYFKPIVTGVKDDDILTFTIENKPEWAIFEKKTGILRGMPKKEQSGYYDNISISVSNGKETSQLSNFGIEVKLWEGYSFCSAEEYDTITVCGPISNKLVTQAQCDSWATLQGLKQNTAVIHINEVRKDELETLADLVCDSREASYDPLFGCPDGYIPLDQPFGLPRCMEDLNEEEIAEKLQYTMNQDLENYLTEKDSEAIPDFVPLEPTLSEPDANGNRTLTIPPPISIQNTLEKQRRKSELEMALGGLDIFTDCSSLVDQGNSWNKSVCFSWSSDQLGDLNFGAKADAMAYMRVSGDSAASFDVTAHIFGNSQKMLHLFSKIQIYTLPDSILTAADIISDAVNEDPDEALKKILARPELQEQLEEFIDQNIIDTLKEAQTDFEIAKANIDKALGKGRETIEAAQTAFEDAKSKLEEAKTLFNNAKQQAQYALPTLEVEKSEFLSKVSVFGQTVDVVSKEAEGKQPLTFSNRDEPLKYTIPIVEVNYNGVVPPCIPVTAGAKMTGELSLEYGCSIANPLDKDNATANAYLQPALAVNAIGSAGVGNSNVASAGIEADLEVINADVKFELLSRAIDFPDTPPLILVDWEADLLSGKVSAYVEVAKTIMRVVNTVSESANWLVEQLGIKEELIPEIKINRHEKELFNYNGFHYPKEQTCNNGNRNRKIIYCSRPSECYINTCEDNNQYATDDVVGAAIILRTVKDKKTGLEWTKDSFYAQISDDILDFPWDSIIYPARNYCQSLPGGDWDLPTITELQTLLITDSENYPYIDQSFDTWREAYYISRTPIFVEDYPGWNILSINFYNSEGPISCTDCLLFNWLPDGFTFRCVR